MFPLVGGSIVYSRTVRYSGRNGGASKVGSEREGVMQVQYSGRRGFICDNDWDNIDAQVACLEFDQYNRNADTTPKGE